MSILSKVSSAFSPTPFGGEVPPAMIVVEGKSSKLASVDNPRPTGGLGALSASGTVSYGGFIHYPTERDRAWVDQQTRDETIIEMSNNPILGGVLRQIAMFIRQVEWKLTPANESDEAERVRLFYQTQLDGMDNLWPGETMPQMLTFLTWGWAALEIIHKPLPDGGIGWKEWRLIPQETRWRWEFNEFGDATHLIQLDPLTWKEIRVPLGRCIHLRDTSRNNSPEGFTLFRIVYDAYFYRSGFQQLEGTLFERYGGVQVARIPGDDIKDNSAAYQDLKRIVTTLGINAQTGLVLASDRDPVTNEFYQDFSIEAPASGATVPSADPIINRYANEMVGVYGAAVTRTGQDGSGSYALADVQSDVFIRNMEAYLDLIRDCIVTQAFPTLYNFPYNNIPPELVPKLSHGKLDKIKLKELGTYLTTLAQSGVLQDSAELRYYAHEQASLPVATVEEIQKEMDKAAAEAKKAAEAFQQSSQDSTQISSKVNTQKSAKVSVQKVDTQKST